MAFILSDENFAREKVTGRLIKGAEFNKYFNTPNSKYHGHALCILPFETFTSLNPTTPIGMTTGIMVSLSFQLKKWEYQSQKVEEWIEVNPSYAQYYQLTLKQRDELEREIKQGLASAAQSVADLELLKHDQRKYLEFLNYLGYEDKGYHSHTSKLTENPKLKDEHALKSVFIDQVDAHTGEGISMRSIVSRWPTLIVDFQSLDDNDIEVDKIKEKLDVSKAEAVVLSTKNRLYNEWKKLFVPEIKGRYERIVDLVRSRHASVEQYRNWLKPLVARHKLLAGGLENRSVRDSLRTSDIYQVGAATAVNALTFWAWRDFEPVEAFRHGGSEQLAKERAEGNLDPYDEWSKKHLIFHPEHGLISSYPWITDKWAKNYYQRYIDNRWMYRHKLYYSFLVIDFIRGSFRMPSGGEFDDSVFDINAIFMSQNVLYAKLLELEAKKADFNHYVDSLIGVRDPDCPICEHETGKSTAPSYEYKESPFEKINNVLSDVGLNMAFFKQGPYERDFDERLTKLHLTGMASLRYQPIVRFIKDKVGYGVS
jgi:hypothetical protein